MAPQTGDALRIAVTGVLAIGGPGVLSNPDRFRNMLSDALGSDRGAREQQLLVVQIVREDLARELLAGAPSASRRAELIGRVQNNSTADRSEVAAAFDLLIDAIDRSGIGSAASAPDVGQAAAGAFAADIATSQTTLPRDAPPVIDPAPPIAKQQAAADTQWEPASPARPPTPPAVDRATDPRVSRSRAALIIAVAAIMGALAVLVVVMTRSDDAETATASVTTGPLAADTVVPALTVLSPTEGASTNDDTIDLAGTTDAGAVVHVNGRRADVVNADGTWRHRLSGLTSGPNSIDVVATGANGVTSRRNVTVLYTPASTPPTPTPTAAPPASIASSAPTAGEESVNEWLAILGSLDTSSTSLAEAQAQLSSLAQGDPNARILLSDDFASLRPGYWVVYVGGFASDAAALEFCDSRGLAVPDQCYSRYLSHDPNDRAG